MALRSCQVFGCGVLSEAARCPEHTKKQDRQRGTARERFYTHAWELYRISFLLTHPLCAECMRQGRVTAATVVDHIVPHKGNEKLFWDPKNHQALCDWRSPYNCHGKKSAQEGAFGRPALTIAR